MPTYQKCAPGVAKGLAFTKVKAAYGMGVVRSTIAPVDQRYKPVSIKPASWVYRPGAAGQRLIKASEARKA